MIVDQNKKRDWQKILRLGLFSVSLIPIIVYFYLLTQRMPIPFDLEWGEGAGINQIHRIISGNPLYGAPTLEFAPLVYSPTYYLISALFALLLDDLFMAGRLVSVLASLGAVCLIACLVWRETRDAFSSWLAGALFIGCFAISDGFFDLVRVDSLYVFLILSAFLVLLTARNRLPLIGGGFGIALAFFTKQSALIVFIPLLVYLLAKNWRRYGLVAAAAGAGVIVPLWLVNSKTSGWFSYYLIRLPAEHGYSFLDAVDFWLGDLISPLGIALAIGLMVIVFRDTPGSRVDLKQADGPKRDKNVPAPEPLISYYLFFALGAIGAAWVTRASNGGGANNVMPAYAAISILFGLGYRKTVELLHKLGQNAYRGQILFGALIMFQFLGLIYNPLNFIPTQAEIAANLLLLDEIKNSEKPVLVPYRSHLALLAGKDPMIHVVNLFELTGYFKGNILPEGRNFIEQIQEGICGQDYGMVVLDQPVPWFEGQLAVAYQIQQTDPGSGGSRSTLLSWQGGLEAVYYPQEGYDQEACLETIK